MQDLDRLVLEEVPDAVIVTTPAGEIVHWNRGAARVFGTEAGEAIGAALQEVVEAVDPDAEAQAVDETRRRGELTYESVYRSRDGSLAYFDVSCKVVPGTGRAGDVVLRTYKDVTDLKLERDARSVAAKFAELLELTPDAIVIVHPSGRIVLTNSQAEALFGYGPGELRGAPIEVLLPQRFHAAHLAHRANYFAQPRTRAVGRGLELYGLRKDGSEFPVEISLSPLKTDGDTLVMSAVRDISERNKAEQKFRGLLESAPDAMVIVNSAGDIVLVNSQAERLFGYGREELLGKPVEVLVPNRFAHRHPDYRRGFFGKPHPRAMGAGLELFGLRRNGTEFPVEISLSPLETEEEVLVSSAIRDITDRKNIERALHEKNIELEAAAKAKDRFLATMSHELRTPLNAIIGYTGTLLMQLPGPLTSDQEKQLSTIQTSAKHLLSLINDLLDLAKIESGSTELRLEPVACGEAIVAVADTLRPLAERKGLCLDVVLPDDELILDTDRRAFSQIVINLASNAIKYTDEGGATITLGRRSSDGETIAVVEVADTGCGISDEDQQRLFEPFMQLDSSSTRRHEGTGLGLHLSAKLADLIGGRISCQSEPGEGATFTLEIPAGAR